MASSDIWNIENCFISFPIEGYCRTTNQKALNYFCTKLKDIELVTPQISGDLKNSPIRIKFANEHDEIVFISYESFLTIIRRIAESSLRTIHIKPEENLLPKELTPEKSKEEVKEVCLSSEEIIRIKQEALLAEKQKQEEQNFSKIKKAFT